jgi:hypothetical protein
MGGGAITGVIMGMAGVAIVCIVVLFMVAFEV